MKYFKDMCYLQRYVLCGGSKEELIDKIVNKNKNKPLDLEKKLFLTDYIENINYFCDFYTEIQNNENFYVDDIPPDLNTDSETIEKVSEENEKLKRVFLNNINKNVVDTQILRKIYLNGCYLEMFTDESLDLLIENLEEVKKNKIFLKCLNDIEKANLEIDQKLENYRKKYLEFLTNFPDNSENRKEFIQKFDICNKILDNIKRQEISKNIICLVYNKEIPTKLDKFSKSFQYNIFCQTNKELGIDFNNEGYYEINKVFINENNLEKVVGAVIVRNNLLKNFDMF